MQRLPYVQFLPEDRHAPWYDNSKTAARYPSPARSAIVPMMQSVTALNDDEHHVSSLVGLDQKFSSRDGHAQESHTKYKGDDLLQRWGIWKTQALEGSSTRLPKPSGPLAGLFNRS